MSAASLDDIDSETSYDSEEEYRLAQQEWEESLKQLQQLVSLVALPMFGKFLGRQWSYWRAFGIPLAVLLSSLVTFADVHHFFIATVYARYTKLGLGKAFLFG